MPKLIDKGKKYQCVVTIQITVAAVKTAEIPVAVVAIAAVAYATA